jgi:hypothetical protein
VELELDGSESIGELELNRKKREERREKREEGIRFK